MKSRWGLQNSINGSPPKLGWYLYENKFSWCKEYRARLYHEVLGIPKSSIVTTETREEMINLATLMELRLDINEVSQMVFRSE